MNLYEALRQAKAIIENEREFCVGAPEEQTKLSLIVPIIRNVFGVSESGRHLRAEYGPGSPEKVDYAIVDDEQRSSLLIECKPLGTVSDPTPHHDQLARYFGMGGCRLICLTDGQTWHFFSDLLREGTVDRYPCRTLDFTNLTQGDYDLVAQMRVHATHPQDLYNIVTQSTLQSVLRRHLYEHASEFLASSGVDIEVPARAEAYATVLRAILNGEESSQGASELVAPSAFLYQPIRTPASEIEPVPADIDLSQGEIYRICWNSWTVRQSPYDGFIWIEEPNRTCGRCHILPGSRIKPTAHPSFRKDKSQKTVNLRRDVINAQGGTVLSMMEISAVGSAIRIIAGANMCFRTARKQRISSNEYYRLVPEAYDPMHNDQG